MIPPFSRTYCRQRYPVTCMYFQRAGVNVCRPEYRLDPHLNSIHSDSKEDPPIAKPPQTDSTRLPLAGVSIQTNSRTVISESRYHKWQGPASSILTHRHPISDCNRIFKFNIRPKLQLKTIQHSLAKPTRLNQQLQPPPQPTGRNWTQPRPGHPNPAPILVIN